MSNDQDTYRLETLPLHLSSRTYRHVEKDCEAMNRLFKVLSPESDRVIHPYDLFCTRDTHPDIHIIVVRYDSEIIAMTTLIPMQQLGMRYGVIHDVVVSEAHERKGLATKMLTKALDLAKRLDLSFLELTSSPTRGGAIRRYTEIGFRRRDTGVYRLTF